MEVPCHPSVPSATSTRQAHRQIEEQGSRVAEPGFDRFTEDPCFGATRWAGTP
jgi:hypothetical protein